MLRYGRTSLAIAAPRDEPAVFGIWMNSQRLPSSSSVARYWRSETCRRAEIPNFSLPLRTHVCRAQANREKATLSLHGSYCTTQLDHCLCDVGSDHFFLRCVLQG